MRTSNRESFPRLNRLYEGLGWILKFLDRQVSEPDVIGDTPNCSQLEKWLRGMLHKHIKKMKKQTIFPIFFQKYSKMQAESILRQGNILSMNQSQKQIEQELTKLKKMIRKYFLKKYIQIESQLKQKYRKKHVKTNEEQIKAIFLFTENFLKGNADQIFGMERISKKSKNMLRKLSEIESTECQFESQSFIFQQRFREL